MPFYKQPQNFTLQMHEKRWRKIILRQCSKLENKVPRSACLKIYVFTSANYVSGEEKMRVKKLLDKTFLNEMLKIDIQ